MRRRRRDIPPADAAIPPGHSRLRLMLEAIRRRDLLPH